MIGPQAGLSVFNSVRVLRGPSLCSAGPLPNFDVPSNMRGHGRYPERDLRLSPLCIFEGREHDEGIATDD